MRRYKLLWVVLVASVGVWLLAEMPASTQVVITPASPYVNASGVARGNISIPAAGGLALADGAPGVTTNKLYNVGGTLTWNGSAVGGAAAAGSLTGTTLAANVVTSSLTGVGVIATGTWASPFSGVTRTATSAQITLTSASTPLQSVVPGADLDVVLPTAAANMYFSIHCGAAFTLTIKDAAAATVSAATNGQTVNVVYDGTSWVVW